MIPTKWMGRTVKQEHILRVLDQLNIFDDILSVDFVSSSAVDITDCYCMLHRFICDDSGEVTLLNSGF